MAVTINASTSSGLVQTADTSGTVEIQSNGSTKLTIASTGVSGTVVSGTAVASTSGTSIDFTGIPSWAKRITVMFSGVSTSGTSNWLIQIGDSGGIETTGYGSSGSRGASTIASVNSTAGYILPLADATTPMSGSITISSLTGNTWVASGILGADNTAYFLFTGGTKTTSATLDRVRITTANGTDTFDAGSINILYEG